MGSPMHAAELGDEVESAVQASAVGVREFRCESHRQTFTFYTVGFTSYT